MPRLGIEIDLDRLKNPKIIRLIKKRSIDFMFNYGDHNDHSEYGDYSARHTDEYKEYNDDAGMDEP